MKKKPVPPPAPKGNKYAVGNNGGRPRSVSPSPEELISLGEEMCLWVAMHKPIHLSKWYAIEKDISDKEWNTYIKRPEFIHYYEKALKLVGYSYIDKDSQVENRIKDRWMRVYFKDLRDQEDADADADALRKKSVANAVNPEAYAQFAQWMQMFAQTQSVNNDLTNNNTDKMS